MKTCVTQNVKGFQSQKDGDITGTRSGKMSRNNMCALRHTLTFIPAQTAFCASQNHFSSDISA